MGPIEVIMVETAGSGAPAPVGGGQEGGAGQTRKVAHVTSDGSDFGCVLLGVSPSGAEVRLLVPAELPDTADLWLPGGERRPVRRCWQRGRLVGFEAVERRRAAVLDGGGA